MARRNREGDDDAIHKQMYDTLKKHFNHTDFREGQKEVIAALLRGESALAVFPTGSGKSLCYQLPAILMPEDSLTIVVSPLIALMKDQVDQLRNNKKYPIHVDSTGSFQNEAERRKTREDLCLGKTKMIFLAPEQLSNEITREILKKRRCELFVIDESHSIAEWGASFRPSYLRVAKFATEEIKARRVLALTATATKEVSGDIVKSFKIPPQNHFQTSMYRPNLQIRFHTVHNRESAFSKLVELLQRPTPTKGPSIVYATTQKETENIELELKRAGFRKVDCYHAGLDSEKRVAVQNDFMAKGNNDGIIVATIAFGMGVDKANIRKVIHFNLSKSLEGYSQEIGRAGRDGEKSYCDLILNMDDVSILEAFASCDSLAARNIDQFLKNFFDPKFAIVGQVRDFSAYGASRSFDMSEVTVNMLLAWLELHHHLFESLTPIYDEHCIRWVNDNTGEYLRSRVPAAIDSLQPPSVAAAVKQNTVYKKTWAYVSAADAAKDLMRETGQDQQFCRGAVSAALSDLEGKGLCVKGTGTRYRFLIKRVPRTEKEFRDIMKVEYQRSHDREVKDLDRIRDVLNLITFNGCYAKKLMSYFGEDRGVNFKCGSCDNCQNKKVHKLPPNNMMAKTVPAAEWRGIERIAALQPQLLESPRALARFAVGGKSPLLTQLRLTNADKTPEFGSLMGLCPWAPVLKKCEEFCRHKDSDVY